MTIAICTSPSPRDVWTVKSVIYDWFVSLVADNDAEAASELRMAAAVNGMSLDLLKANDKHLAEKLVRVLRHCASDVAAGRREIPPELTQSQAEIKRHFVELVGILDRFQ